MKNKKLVFRIILFLIGVVCFLILFGKLERQKQLSIVDKKEETEKEEVFDTIDKTKERKLENTTLSFVGDVLLSDGVLNYYDRKGIDGILEKKAVDELTSADITIINNEFPFSTRGKKADDKQYTFRVAPDRVGILKELGVDIASLANNHSLDFGTEALLDTCETLKEVKIEYVGAGKDINEAKEIRYRTVNGRTFAFIAASRVIPVTEWNAGINQPGLLTTYDPVNVLELIKMAKKQADTVIVYVHWGIERKNIPEDYQRNLGKMYIDAGADLIVGSHSHCLQGIEYYKEKPIIYSLGNFIFGTKIERTAILKARVNENGTITLSVIPCKADDFKTIIIKDKEEIESFYNFYEKISYEVSFEGKGEERTIVSTH